MKVLIFNSGIGKRMGELTAHCPKSMVKLYNGETIFERQIRLIQESGLRNIVITTGQYPEMLQKICEKPCFKNLNFTFVHNDKYNETNYIYSMYLARDFLDDDIIMMHGDLVFDRKILPAILKSKNKNLCLINKLKKLPEKDFKGRIENNKLLEVGINIFDENCFAFQPIYKLDKCTIKKWITNVNRFIAEKNVGVYAENALNEISSTLNIIPFSYSRFFVDEIDNANDLARVNECIMKSDNKNQIICTTQNLKLCLNQIIQNVSSHKPFIILPNFMATKVKTFLNNGIFFSSFTANPKYEEMLNGLKIFKKNNCDSIIAIGGGSAIDIAKTIKLSFSSNPNSNIPTYEQKNIGYERIPLIVVPTTAGTGSESTKHAVIYLNNIKQSISSNFILPDYVILSPNLIKTLPDFQKKCTSLDALCQCFESLWSKKANSISKKYAAKGIRLFMSSYDKFIVNNIDSIKKMQLAANFSGKAINISETTAAHALSYKLTSLFNIPHGYAVALCFLRIIDYLDEKTFKKISKNTELKSKSDLKNLFIRIFDFYNLPKKIDYKIKPHEIETLEKSVNQKRLENFPVKLLENDIRRIYLDLF